MKNSKKAFTLVELIVVITILAILGTIAFISLQGYSKSARDSRRISDISNIKKSLELFQLNTGKYPIPDIFSTMAYSGETMFYQGTIGNNVTQNLSANLQEKPLDPLHEIEYLYSTTFTRKEYEVLTILENTNVYKNTLNNSYAFNFKIKTNGNYNGLFLKTPSFIVPTPSIITSASLPVDVKDTPDAMDSFVLNDGDNVPSLGIPGLEAQKGGLDINLSATGVIDANATDEEKKSVIKAIQDAYTGTTLTTKTIIENVLSKTTDEEKLNFIDVTVLGTGTPIQSTTSTPSPTFGCTGTIPTSNVTTLNNSGLSADTPWQNTDSGAFCYYECNSGYTLNGGNCELNTGSYTYSTHTFSTCGSSGVSGPTLAQCNSSYSTTWDGNTSFFNVINGIQYWTIPETGTYRIEAYGAQGGGQYGGLGAKMIGEFNLTQGEQLKILVGQAGEGVTASYRNGGTGGGGSFVTNSSNSPYIIAGGGGGASYEDYSTANGTTSSGGNAGLIYRFHEGVIWIGGDECLASGGRGFGGSSGNAGQTGEGTQLCSGGGGAGLNSMCGNYGTSYNLNRTFQRGPCGVHFAVDSEYVGMGGENDLAGGFGGGGGISLGIDTYSYYFNSSGGGGGYSGGGAAACINLISQGNYPVVSGGGGSYNSGANQNNASGANSGHGKVIIVKL